MKPKMIDGLQVQHKQSGEVWTLVADYGGDLWYFRRRTDKGLQKSLPYERRIMARILINYTVYVDGMEKKPLI